jgi:hypothetical protein
MPTTNDITGDKLISRVNTPEFEANFERIFGTKNKKPETTKTKQLTEQEPKNGVSE